MRDIDNKVDALIKTFHNLQDYEIRNKIIEFAEELAGYKSPTAKLSIQDLDRIRDFAIGSWLAVNPDRLVEGERLSGDQISAVMWLSGVVMVLRGKGLLPRPVEPDFDAN